MIAARVEDLPEPVGPVTSTMPLRRPTIFSNSAGRLSALMSGTTLGITRITIAQEPRCLKMLTRNRCSPCKLYDTSQEPSSFKLPSACWLLPMRSEAIRCVSSAVSTRVPVGASFPLTSTRGGFPGVKKRSLIFAEVLSIAASRAGVEIGAVAGAAAVAAPEATLGATFAGDDIKTAVLGKNQKNGFWFA